MKEVRFKKLKAVVLVVVLVSLVGVVLAVDKGVTIEENRTGLIA